MSVDLSAIREAGKSVGWIDRRILSIANRLFSKRLEGLRLGGPRIVDIPFVLGASGSALTAGAHVFFRLSLGGDVTVLGWSLGATVGGVAFAGTASIDVRVGATLATVASICGSALPALAARSELSDQAPTGWTSVFIADPSTVLVRVMNTSVIEVLSLTLKLAVATT